MLHLLVVSLLFLLSIEAQTYCQQGKGFVNDTNGECLLSSNYDVENCCYTCPIRDASGLVLTCGSLYELGFAACGQAGALAARQTACSVAGGDITSGAFMCLCNTGTNKSQVNYVSLAPTVAALTTAPTASGPVVSVSSLMFFSVFMLYALSH